MTTATEHLARDLAILVAMAAEMETYLNSDVLFWQMSKSGMPKLTLGGYLIRQHRLLLLQDLLNDAHQADLDTAVTKYNNTLVEKIVRFEQKAHRELDARLRQWGEYLKDVDRGVASTTSNYRTAVDVRAMIAAIMDQLKLPPYSLDQRIPQQAALLDNQLRRLWEHGSFVWPEEWQPAYPQMDFWWLYGNPKEKRNF